MKTLTLDQEEALHGILEFIKKPIIECKDCSTILYAAAGCGKTFLTRHIADKLRGSYVIAGVAPTHKARKVLDKFLNDKTFYKIKTMTVASLLGKLRSHSYIGTKNYKETNSKIHLYNLFIIDEVSMINDEDIKKIVSYAFKFKRKMLFVGDKYQIPNPVQHYILEDGMAYKADSNIFNIPGFELTTNLRQKENNPIIPIYLEIRKAIDEKREADISRENNMKNGIGINFYLNKEEWYLQMTEIYLNSEELHNVKILAYTNDAVKIHNQSIRNLYGRGIKPERGELLMGYNNLGFPEPYISNGQDYYIINITDTTTYKILNYRNLVGYIMKTKECDTNIQADLFVCDISHYNNQEILQDLVKRAEKVNSKYSTKTDYKKYCDIRNKLIFMENIYKYQNEIITESQFRCNNPLLFKNISEVIDSESKIILNNKLTEDINEKYGEILNERLEDNKNFSNVEKLCDQFCIIEKDIDYGYSVTSHKSQGSTYRTVFIDEADFDKLKDYFNYKFNCEVKTVKEKNQLKYVCYTRPSNNAYVFYKD